MLICNNYITLHFSAGAIMATFYLEDNTVPFPQHFEDLVGKQHKTYLCY